MQETETVLNMFSISFKIKAQKAEPSATIHTREQDGKRQHTHKGKSQLQEADNKAGAGRQELLQAGEEMPAQRRP